MILLSYQTELTPEMIADRFAYWLDDSRRNPWNPIQNFENPRIGFHVSMSPLKKGMELSGYYETGYRSHKTGRLKNNKIWFSLDLIPHKKGTKVVGYIHNSPHETYSLWIFLAVVIVEVLVQGTAVSLSGLLLFLSAATLVSMHKQRQIREDLLRLIPPLPKESK